MLDAAAAGADADADVVIGLVVMAEVSPAAGAAVSAPPLRVG